MFVEHAMTVPDLSVAATPAEVSQPALFLEGKKLAKGWTVIKQVDRPSNATGGYFSVGYIVENETGTRGFLKAFDFSRARGQTDELRELQRLLQAYNFERDLLELCRTRRLSRVAQALEDGNVDVPGAGILSRVYYVIFELAQGDIRSYVDMSASVDYVWRLRTLHNAAVGLQQLHKQMIAHQDVKPSNVLVFPDGAKVTDLGRASRDGVPAPHDELAWAGQSSYAPIELLYFHQEPDFRRRRVAADLYLLGSLILFFFANVGMTTAIVAELDDSHRPDGWTGDYQQVLPYVRAGFGNVCEAFRLSLEDILPPKVADGLLALVQCLCDPDPRLRGHPINRNKVTTQYSLERVVTRLNVLADEALMARR